MNSAWERAIKQGDVAEVQRLLKAGAAVNAKDRYGQTALMLAAMYGHLETVELLIAEGADLNLTAKFTLSALMLAVINRHTEVAKSLAQAGADLVIQGSGAPGFAGKTAYDLAIATEMAELYDQLKPGSAQG